MKKEKIYNDLLKKVKSQIIKLDEPLKKHTYTKIGGNADVFVMPTSIEEIKSVVNYAFKNKITITYLGNGSNLIIKDGGIRGIVLSLLGLNEMKEQSGIVHAQSGASIIEVSQYALSKFLTGLEFACGIPGTVGGALYMNAGAYGGEIKDVLKSAIVLTQEGKIIEMESKNLDLEYRSSNIANKKLIVLEAKFELNHGDYKEIKEKMDELTYLRETKQPLEYPSCGSVFKRPKGNYAGKLIQDSDLQGKRFGGAEVSKKHAGFIVNVDNATASDYIRLIEHVQENVREKFDIQLEREVKIIGEDLIEENIDISNV